MVKLRLDGVNKDGKEDTRWIRNSLAVAKTGREELHILSTIYPESDSLNPGGQLLCHVSDEEGNTRSVLSTSRPVAVMWRSPRKHLWLGSSDGHVWTTARMPWPRIGNEDFVEGERWTWTSISIPDLEGIDQPPNITVIWGTSESNVLFGTASGSIYLWDGREWRLSLRGDGRSLTKIHGISPDNVYAAGYGGTILRWDGELWKRMQTPLDAETTIVTGIAIQQSGNAYAVTNRGQFLTALAGDFLVSAEAPVWFTGLVAWKGVLAASSTQGAWIYSEKNGLRNVKTNFAATDVMVVQDELHFIESEQTMGPAVIEYKAKRIGAQWQRVVF